MNGDNHYTDEILDRVSTCGRTIAVNSQVRADHSGDLGMAVAQPGRQPGGTARGDAADRPGTARWRLLTRRCCWGYGRYCLFRRRYIALDEHEVRDLHDDSEFVDLRSVGAVMDRSEASILAYAKGIMHWHARHLYCGVCGSPTEIRDAGHLRKCLNRDCGAVHFPRTDPAVIMLVAKDDRALLGRKAEWMEGCIRRLPVSSSRAKASNGGRARGVRGIGRADRQYPVPFVPALAVSGVMMLADATEDSCGRGRTGRPAMVYAPGTCGRRRRHRQAADPFIARRLIMVDQDGWLTPLALARALSEPADYPFETKRIGR